MSAVPARSPYQAGDRVQMHGYPGGMTSRDRTGFRGVVEASLGATILRGTTDDGQPWAEYWGALVPDGTPNDSAAPCTCCPAGKPRQARPLASAASCASRPALPLAWDTAGAR
jgi:hypothetical protein